MNGSLYLFLHILLVISPFDQMRNQVFCMLMVVLYLAAYSAESQSLTVGNLPSTVALLRFYFQLFWQHSIISVQFLEAIQHHTVQAIWCAKTCSIIIAPQTKYKCTKFG